jgi:hypothetical protein
MASVGRYDVVTYRYPILWVSTEATNFGCLTMARFTCIKIRMFANTHTIKSLSTERQHFQNQQLVMNGAQDGHRQPNSDKGQV